ncbi:MAG TPA: Hsp33 family molecular chaperone HslO [Candidatus Polarisedimenticolaceae bacterium]|nr:Hsp33 family molecular chaperone HslO [Candidatus Polarisedimenticolaceae bacterium]
MELPESRLYAFVDQSREFALHFLEGQRLIRDLAMTHSICGEGFAYFRDVVLSVQPTIALLKQGEQFGFYVDSDAPFFRLKIEAGHHGVTRCALFPDAFREFPPAMRGLVRVVKVFPRNRPPYQSVLEIDGLPLGEIVNRVLRDSYQVNAAIIVSQQSDQSLLLLQLPPLAGAGDYDYSPDALAARRDGLLRPLERLFGRALSGKAGIVRGFASIGFELLAHKPIRFRCSCSHERMVGNLRLACGNQYGELFDPDQQALAITCEYCKSQYSVTRDDLRRAAVRLN